MIQQLVQRADHTNQPIFPEWSTPSEWPWEIDIVVSEARRILSYFEHLTKDQRPPPSLWHSVYKCNQWIEDHAPGKEAKGSNFLDFDESEFQ